MSTNFNDGSTMRWKPFADIFYREVLQREKWPITEEEKTAMSPKTPVPDRRKDIMNN